jgi:hypothetical protein
LGVGIAAFCRLFKPAGGLFGVGLAKRTIELHHGQRKLCAGVAFFGSLAIPFRS